MLARSALAIAVRGIGMEAPRAAEPLHACPPGGALPGMRDAGAAFGNALDIAEQVIAGATGKRPAQARHDADGSCGNVHLPPPIATN